MLKNYFKIAWRSLWKHKLFSFINIFGLAFSLSVCMIVIVQIKDDLNYDLFHPHADRTYRILSDIVENKNDKQYTLASTPLPLASKLSRDTAVVEHAVQIYPALKGKAGYGDKELYINGAFTDKSFFEIFGFRLSVGDKKTALELTNVNQLMFLLSKGFLKLLLIAGLIATPLGYVSSFLFLQNFANRVPIGLGLCCSVFCIC